MPGKRKPLYGAIFLRLLRDWVMGPSLMVGRVARRWRHRGGHLRAPHLSSTREKQGGGVQYIPNPRPRTGKEPGDHCFGSPASSPAMEAGRSLVASRASLGPGT